MTVRERFRLALDGKMDRLDRLPAIEWASWWNLTLDRWALEGVERTLSEDGRFDFFDLDRHSQ